MKFIFKNIFNLQTAVEMHLKVRELHLVHGSIVVIVIITLYSDNARFLINQNECYIIIIYI